ncbi:NAD(P)H-hydrate dehydratase, partial [Delftia acidovorans]
PWPEIMLRSPEAQDWRSTTVACGCGGGVAVRAWLPQILEQAPRLVLDADALNAVAEDESLASLLKERRQRNLHTVLTPHPLEAARLLKTNTAQVQAQRLHAARQLAQRFNCTALLKGSGTVIAGPQGDSDAPTCWINPTGNARLSTGGTGDVLAGLIAALWAQGLEPTQAAALAAWRHGFAADHWPARIPFSASALAQRLGA